jgi:hypothetical protein
MDHIYIVQLKCWTETVRRILEKGKKIREFRKEPNEVFLYMDALLKLYGLVIEPS